MQVARRSRQVQTELVTALSQSKQTGFAKPPRAARAAEFNPRHETNRRTHKRRRRTCVLARLISPHRYRAMTFTDQPFVVARQSSVEAVTGAPKPTVPTSG